MIVFMLFLIGMFLWGNSVDPIPLGLLIVLVAIPVVIIVCIIKRCFNRQNKRNRWRRRR